MRCGCACPWGRIGKHGNQMGRDSLHDVGAKGDEELRQEIPKSKEFDKATGVKSSPRGCSPAAKHSQTWSMNRHCTPTSQKGRSASAEATPPADNLPVCKCLQCSGSSSQNCCYCCPASPPPVPAALAPLDLLLTHVLSRLRHMWMFACCAWTHRGNGGRFGGRLSAAM